MQNRGSLSVARGERSFLSHAATYAIGNIARRLVGFVMLPIYTRYLTPADYGVIGLLTFAMALFEPIFGARLGRAIPKFYLEKSDSRSRAAVIWGALTLTGGVSLITTIGVVFARRAGSEILFGDSKYSLALGLFAINLLTQPIEQTGMAYIRLQGRSRLFLGFSLVKLFVQLGMNLLLVVYWREGVLGVVNSGIASSVLMGVAVTVYVAAHEKPVIDWNLTQKMLQFCWPLWLSGLAGLYIGSSGSMYLRMFDNLSDVGRLQLGMKLASTVGLLLWAPFSQHWEPMSFRYYREPQGERKFQVAFIAVGALMITGGLGISVFAEPVVRVMAAKPFQAAAAVVPILVLGIVLNRLSSFFNFSFIVTGHTKIHSVCQYSTAVVITVAYVVLVPRFGLVGAAYAQLVGYATGFGLIQWLSKKYYDPGYDFRPLLGFLVIGAMGYLVSTLGSTAHDILLDLTIKSLAWGLSAGLIAWVAVRTLKGVDSGALAGLPPAFRRLLRVSAR